MSGNLALDSTEEAILNLLQSGAKRAEDLERALGLPAGEVRTALRRLRANGFISQTLEYSFEVSQPISGA